MNRVLLLSWKLMLMLGLAIWLGQSSGGSVSADKVSNAGTPPLVENAAQEELDDLLESLQLRIGPSLRELPDSVKVALTESTDTLASPTGSLLPGGISLRGLWFDPEKRLVIDLGQEARSLDAATFELVGDYVIHLVNDELNNKGFSRDRMSYYFAIEGVGVEMIYRPFPDTQAMDNSEGTSDVSDPVLDIHFQPLLSENSSAFAPAVGVNGRRIAINPGHGYYDAGGTWTYSGALVEGVQEDNLNNDMAVRLRQALQNSGVYVIPLRELDREPAFDSIRKWWQMGAREYARLRLSQPEWVWNTASAQTDPNRWRDLNARPFLAAAFNADLLISIHNNSSIWPPWGEEWCGSLILYDNSNSRRSQSQKLADALTAKLNDLKSSYSWYCGARVVGRNDKAEGENYYAYSPSVVVEVGNLKNASIRPKLQDAAFQQVAMNKVRDGVSAYYGSMPVSCPSSYTWRTEYWNNTSMFGYPTQCRDEATINHDWGSGGPSGIPNDWFSMRATSTQYFTAGNYRFYLGGDDGVRLWLDGILRIDQWKPQGYTEYSYNTNLSAGKHSLLLEYFENAGSAAVKFRAELMCPNQYKAEYFNNRSLSGNPTFVRCENWPINRDWGGGGPGNGVGNDNFSARWTGRAHINSGNYTFIARADDGVRVWVGGNLLIDAWRDQAPTEYRVTRYINNGDYDIKVEYYENGGGAVAQFRWEQASVTCPNQYKAEYFNNRSLSGSPTFVRCENWPVNWDWGGGGPGNGVGNDNFSARWTGRARINSGNYTFIARADDGVRVWVGGNLLIDAWRDQGPTEYRVTRYINNGDYDIKVEYYENGGGAVAQFRWEQASSGSSYNRLVAKHSGRCVDVSGASRDNGAVIIQWDCHTGDNQLWSLVPAGNDYYKLVAKHSGKCLDVYGASRDNGARLIQWDCHGGDNQLFKREQFGSYYRLRAKHSNRCIDVYGGQRDNGVRLIQWDCHGGDNQLWAIQSRTAAVQDDQDGLGVQPVADEYILPIGDAAVIARIEHTVQEGDSLALMAGVYDVSVATILEANPELADASAVQPGMTLYVPLSVPYGETKRLYLPAILR